MLQPYRTRSLRRIKVRLPGGRVAIHYKKRNPKQAKCAETKKPLPGIPRYSSRKLGRLPKSQRKPNRPYGGVFSSEIMRKKISESFPMINKPLDIGQVVVKLAGRDAGKIGVIVDMIDNHTVLIDGQVRRRNCNIAHIGTLDQKMNIKQKASSETVKKELELLNIKVEEKREKPTRQEKTQKKEKKDKEAKVPKQKKVKTKNE